jgi:hypothetical protein
LAVVERRGCEGGVHEDPHFRESGFGERVSTRVAANLVARS